MDIYDISEILLNDDDYNTFSTEKIIVIINHISKLNNMYIKYNHPDYVKIYENKLLKLKNVLRKRKIERLKTNISFKLYKCNE